MLPTSTKSTLRDSPESEKNDQGDMERMMMVGVMWCLFVSKRSNVTHTQQGMGRVARFPKPKPMGVVPIPFWRENMIARCRTPTVDTKCICFFRIYNLYRYSLKWGAKRKERHDTYIVPNAYREMLCGLALMWDWKWVTPLANKKDSYSRAL